MRSRLTSCAILFLLLGTFARPVRADDAYRSKFGFDIKGFKGNLQKTFGWLGGLRWARYFGSSQVYMGLGGEFGAPTGQALAAERMYYGGLVIGYDGRMSKVFVYELGFLAGYGEGYSAALNIYNKSYLVVEPSLSAGFALGGGWRLEFAASYLHMDNGKYFSGPTFGLRFQFRSSSSVKDVND